MSSRVETVTASELVERPIEPKVLIDTPTSQSSTLSSSTSNTTRSYHAQPTTEVEIASKSNVRTFLTIATASFVGFLSSFTNGLITVGLPTIARSISLERSLYLWPSSVSGLTSGAALLIAGSIADIVGARSVEIVGISLLGIFSLACGFAQTGAQLVAFRALQGIALAMHLPASVSIIASAVPSGRLRNLGFASLGFSQLLGFAVGLVLSGVLIEKAGWRSGFYLCGGFTLFIATAAWWTLPKVPTESGTDIQKIIMKISKEVDWVGGILSSGGLALLAYVLAVISADLTSIRSATTASLLATSIVLLLMFPLWMHYRTRTNKPALIPNNLWRNTPFTGTCIMVGLSFGVVNSMELFSSLYFQEIQHASTMATSLYLLPSLAMGVVVNVSVGFFVHRVSARFLIAGSAMICALAPLFMALMNPKWTYWYIAFLAQVFAPFSADVLLTVGLIIVSDNFPEKTQALAGAVFNTVAQFGMSLGMGSCQVIALGVQSQRDGKRVGAGDGEAYGNNDTGSLLNGYRASYWLMFGYMLMCGLIAVVTLRKAGKVGLKRE